MTAGQKAFLTVVRAEYAAQRKGSTYSEGLDEPWCADFVSWVAKERGAPLKNPHSGGWRVPGVFTLVEVLQKEGTYRAPGSGYVPKLGDIIVYGDSSPYGQHTNYVLVSGQGRVTTLGGNEYGGVAIVEHALDGKLGVIAYGTR